MRKRNGKSRRNKRGKEEIKRTKLRIGEKREVFSFKWSTGKGEQDKKNSMNWSFHETLQINCKSYNELKKRKQKTPKTSNPATDSVWVGKGDGMWNGPGSPWAESTRKSLMTPCNLDASFQDCTRALGLGSCPSHQGTLGSRPPHGWLRFKVGRFCTSHDSPLPALLFPTLVSMLSLFPSQS